MHIIVCVKQVIDTSARIHIIDGVVDSHGSPRVVNPYDEFAVEEALGIRKNHPELPITITALSLGPESFKGALKTTLAMGVDNAIHLSDSGFEGLDNLAVAQILALAIKKIGFDLILCGRQAVDDDMAQVGPSLAVLLNIPFVSVITRLELSQDLRVAHVTRQIEGGSEILESPLPLLLTCQKGLNVPRLPSLKGIMAAKKKSIENLSAADIGFDSNYPEPQFNRVRQVELALPPQREKASILMGSIEESASRLVQSLRDSKIV
jgi:electron transfer flavoprotein beta subunit